MCTCSASDATQVPRPSFPHTICPVLRPLPLALSFRGWGKASEMCFITSLRGATSKRSVSGVSLALIFLKGAASCHRRDNRTKVDARTRCTNESQGTNKAIHKPKLELSSRCTCQRFEATFPRVRQRTHTYKTPRHWMKRAFRCGVAARFNYNNCRIHSLERLCAPPPPPPPK